MMMMMMVLKTGFYLKNTHSYSYSSHRNQIPLHPVLSRSQASSLIDHTTDVLLLSSVSRISNYHAHLIQQIVDIGSLHVSSY